MAIKHLFARGVGFTDGQIGWAVTRGYGDLGGEAPAAPTMRPRRAHAWAAIGFLIVVGLFAVGLGR